MACFELLEHSIC